MFNFGKVLCWQCNSGYILVNGYCVAQLKTYTGSIDGCNSYSFNNYCSQCNTGYVLSPLGTCYKTICQNIPNCLSCGSNYICSTCATGYTLSLGFLSVNGLSVLPVSGMLTAQCIPSTITCNITNCAYCTSNNVCGGCASGYDFPSLGSNVCNPTCNVANCYQCS